MQSKDGKYVIIGGNGDSVYSRLMAAVGRPDMASSNPLYATNTLRCQRADEIYKVRNILHQQPDTHVIAVYLPPKLQSENSKYHCLGVLC